MQSNLSFFGHWYFWFYIEENLLWLKLSDYVMVWVCNGFLIGSWFERLIPTCCYLRNCGNIRRCVLARGQRPLRGRSLGRTLSTTPSPTLCFLECYVVCWLAWPYSPCCDGLKHSRTFPPLSCQCWYSDGDVPKTGNWYQRSVVIPMTQQCHVVPM